MALKGNFVALYPYKGGGRLKLNELRSKGKFLHLLKKKVYQKIHNKHYI